MSSKSTSTETLYTVNVAFTVHGEDVWKFINDLAEQLQTYAAEGKIEFSHFRYDYNPPSLKVNKEVDKHE